MDWKDVEKLSHYASVIGLLYILAGMMSGFWLVYLNMGKEEVPSMVISAHAHFLGLSILILILGLGMHNWAREVKEGEIELTGGSLKSAKIAVGLLALGAIISFVFQGMQEPQLALVGYILYTLGFVMIAFGWVSGSGRRK